MIGMLIFASFTPQSLPEIRYTQPAAILFDWDGLQSNTISFPDTLTGETLLQIKTPDGIPLYYAKDILTNVCFDNECRPLNLSIYWNITGRYLGFGLPEEEFLSRYDHEPFTDEDYSHLNTLLADPYLPLGDVSFEKLIQPLRIPADSIDAVSGATSKDVLPYVVEGAAYTTYTMWNIVYGPAQAQVISITEQEMTPALLALILQSPSSTDKIWGLRKIDGARELDENVEGILLDIVEGEDFFATYSALQVIKPVHLRSESLQIGLFSKYEQLNHSLRKEIIERLKEAPEISPEVIKRSRNLLEGLNGTQLGYMLELYNQHSIKDKMICRSVARLLEKDNKFIAGKAYRYLANMETEDESIIQALKKYKEQLRE